MRFFYAIIGLALCYICIKFRESISNTIGEYDWMHYVGGSQNFVVLIGILIFFWAVAAVTGTQDIFLAPLLWLIPGTHTGGGSAPLPPNTMY